MLHDTEYYTKLYNQIVDDPEHVARLKYGTPRPGHPEGTIEAHVGHLISNMVVLHLRCPELSPVDAERLMILAQVHDAFKGVSGVRVPIESPASLARAYLAKLTDDEDMLTTVQYHDEPQALFRRLEAKGQVDQARLDRLIARIKDWDLFLAFLIMDSCTPGKSRDEVKWFFTVIPPGSKVTIEHIIPDTADVEVVQ
jgi:hypothetical protein